MIGTNEPSTIESEHQVHKQVSNGSEKEIYFIVLTEKDKNDEKEISNGLNFSSEIVPEVYYEKDIEKENGSLIKHRIFKLNIKKDGQEEIPIRIDYEIGNDIYTIKFEIKNNVFIYDPILQKADKFLGEFIVQQIDQNIITLYNKLEIFQEAFEKMKEPKKIEKLYKEAFYLFKNTNDFNLLVFLFIHIYDKKFVYTSLHPELLEVFDEKNSLQNTEIDNNLLINLEIIDKIFYDNDFTETKECSETLKENTKKSLHLKSEKDKNKIIKFYGIILLYLYYYDKDGKYFSLDINELYKVDKNILFDILINFRSHFSKPLNQDFEFYNRFIKYLLDNKYDAKIFEKILNYIKDIETYLKVIYEHRKNIINTYKDIKPIKIPSNLILIKKDNELKKIIDLIKNIIDFSADDENKNKKLLIYFTSKFWKNLIKQYNIADRENIENCHELRKIFKIYYEAVIKIDTNDNKIEKLHHHHDKKSSKDKEKDNDKKDKEKDIKDKVKGKDKKDKEKDKKDKKDKDKKDKGTTDNDNEYIKEIKNDISIYYNRDEFAFILNRNIKDFLEKNKLSNEIILGTIVKFNPYFCSTNDDDEKKYSQKRDVSIFDYINFDEDNALFIDTYKKYKFEKIFKKNLTDYLKKIVSKIKNIENLGTIIKLIDIDSIPDKSKEFYDLLKNKYEEIKKDLKSLKDKKLNNAIKILSIFISKIYLYEKDCKFLNDRISKLDNNIKSSIYNELMKTNKGKDFEELRKNIFKYYLKNLSNVNNIIELINSLQDEDKKIFIKDLRRKCKFSENDFYSNNKNEKIELLCDINESYKLESDCRDEIEEILDKIWKKLDDLQFTKGTLEEFLMKDIKGGKGDSDIKYKIIKKLGLIKIVMPEYDPKDNYEKLNNKITEMNETIEDLTNIKNSLSIFHRTKYKDEINKITKIINDIESKPISEFNNNEMQEDIENLKLPELRKICADVDEVKDLLIFRIIFNNSSGIDQQTRFNNGKRQLDDIKNLFQNINNIGEIDLQNDQFDQKEQKERIKIFNKIKDELSKKEEEKSKEFIDQMIKYFNIDEKFKDNENLKNQYKEDLKMLFKSKKYEMDVKSIKFFFDKVLYQELDLPDNLELSKMKFDEVKTTLNYLKENKKIYDYTSNSNYYKIFTSLYDKKEALDFLIKKKGKNINYLKDRLDPTKRRVTIKHIEDTIECLHGLEEIINKKTESEMLEHIKKLKDEEIEKFVNYSKIYPAIIELDRNDDNNDENIYENVNKIITYASLIFYQDYEDFVYKDKGKLIPTNMAELIHLKNQINIQPKNKKDDKKSVKVNDQFEIKCDKLRDFKDLVANLEIIYDRMKLLRIKGSGLPIKINIKIEYPTTIKYILNNKESTFNEISKFLFKAKNDYENQLNNVYKKEEYLRFLYGKLFRKIQMHLEETCDIREIIRYILNITDNDKEIKDGEIFHSKIKDYVNFYHKCNEESFNNTSKYLISLFNKNDKKINLETHYNEMLILEKNKYKGIYLITSEFISMEEYIIKLYSDKLKQLPIAQNILICSRETSIEEIQSFFYRAILCEYNTLFVIEILESLSDFQYNKIYTFIDKILLIKFEDYKKNNKNTNKLNKINTKDYLNSCIVFIYDSNIDSNSLKELEKYSQKNLEKKENQNIQNINQANNSLNLSFSTILNLSFDRSIFTNIKVISSDVCGLGKSYKIKKMINNKKPKQYYYHFSLGGTLSKKIIYEKIKNLFDKIKKDDKIRKEENKIKSDIICYKDIAIHIDLSESKEISLINEFLFSFLITKFYINNEDIIYIPKDINFYIEIPNCFTNYLTKIGLLNVFDIENIVLGEKKTNIQKNITNINMEHLELDENTRAIFKNMIDTDKNEEIEVYIKSKIGLTEYSYHQVHTFIKLFISQYSKIEGKLNFTDCNGKNITETCIKNFAESTKYFTNGGFAKILMKKTHNNVKDKYDLCLEAYDYDLNNAEFKTLFYLDSKTKKYNIINLGETKQNTNKDLLKNKSKEVDIVYLIDATGSMGGEIKAAKNNVIGILKNLKEKFKEKNFDFKFGAIFYRDKVDSKEDKDDYFPLTNDMEQLKKNISTIKAYGGGDGPEDWVGGYDLALNEIKWRNGSKLIIHIADAGAHGVEFSKGDRHPLEGPKLIPLIQKCVEKSINIIGFKIEDEPEQSFEKIKEIYNDYKIKIKKNGPFIEIYEFNRDKVSEEFYNLVTEATTEVVDSTYFYLKKLKQMLSLPNDIENDIKEDKEDLKSLISILSLETDPYVITDDNYKKMVLLIYRIQADVPVIIMGETGCGKTALIIKLSQLLNNGKKLVEIIKIHPGITDDELCENMRKINEKAKKQEKIDDKHKKEQWIFFDEINTCLSLTLLTEIFINRTFKGEKLEDNIRLIGACNPYRKKKLNSEKYGLTTDEDENNDDNLVYKVQQLPESLLYYVFSFGSLTKENEKDYIYSMTKNLFDTPEEELRKLTTEAISESHIFLRKAFGDDPSVVSLREISRFTKCVRFFQDYFLKKNKEEKEKISGNKKKVYKIKSIICSIYLCYYIRLVNTDNRGAFDFKLKNTLLKLVNVFSEEKYEEGNSDLKNNIKYKPLKDEIRETTIKNFSDFLDLEETFLLEQIDLEQGIAKNQLLKENVFLLFLAVVTTIPLIIVGKPGTGKSLSSKLINNSMRGEYSKNEFFKQYPQIIQIYFQGSKSNIPEDVDKLFNKAENYYANFLKKNGGQKDQAPIYMILFDELGLSEKSPKNPLKVLHHKLEYDGKNDGVCFVGISNYTLDAAKVNRALFLSVPNLEDMVDEVQRTAISIAQNISPELTTDKDKILIFDLLSNAYCNYKEFLVNIKKHTVLLEFFKKHTDLKNKKKNLKEIEDSYGDYRILFNKDKKVKTEFHGNRDFYNIIKSVALDCSKLSNFSEKDIVSIIESYIERNFGGIYYVIENSFDYKLKDTDFENIFYEVLGTKFNSKEKNIEVSSVYIFKNIYNLACENKDNYKIQNIVDKFDLNKTINDNINDNNSRYLLLEIKSNLSSLIIENIKTQNPEKKSNIIFINGSPFSDDNNNDYRFRKIYEIQDYIDKPDKILILQNLNQIQPYLYDLYNMNYKIIDEKKYVRICLENFSEQDTPVDESFRIIILVDREFIDSVDMAFLNRLEKLQINFKELLNNEQIKIIKNILNKIELKKSIKRVKVNYDLNNLLINCGEEEIAGLVCKYFVANENKKKKTNDNEIEKEIEDKIFSKISKILPQDIIAILNEKNVIQEKYFNEKKYYNLKDYIQDLKESRRTNINNYKISIIYTFNNIATNIDSFNSNMKFMISEIRTENQLKIKIDEIKSQYENNEEESNKIILIQFEQYNSNKIQFTSAYIANYYDKDGYNYIFLVHIKRKFGSDDQNRIYWIPNIDSDINQLFIDNLKGESKITLKDLLTTNIKNIMLSGSSMNEEAEFDKSLIKFIYEEINRKNNKDILKNNINEDDYCNKIKSFMENDKDFKRDLIKKAKELISDDKVANGDCGSLIDKMFKENYINPNSIDLITCIVEYIKEKIFNENLKKVFNILEHNNFLTTLIEIDKDKDIKDKLGKDIIKLLKDKCFEIKVDNDKLEPKFLFNYKIPGLFNFYQNLSNYLRGAITFQFFNNEKHIREYFNSNGEKINNELNKYHAKEEELLNDVFNKINQEKIYFDILNQISIDLILNDYITFYLDKYIDKDFYCNNIKRIIELILKIRFSEEKNQIIKSNKLDSIKILLIKIIWIESNTDYIISIIKMFNYAQSIITNELDEIVEELIDNKKINIKYITNKDKNPEHTREVNECFYIILAALCLAITTDEIKLTTLNNHEENIKNNSVNIKNYYDQLIKINGILHYLNYDLIIFLNELYIIDELIKIIDYHLTKGINIENIIKIRFYLRESCILIQSDKNKYLGDNIKNLFNVMKSEERNEQYNDKFYDTLKYIFLNEIKKINDISYRLTIIDLIIKEKDIIKKSNDIFQIFLKFCFEDGYKKTISKLLESNNSLIQILEKNLSDSYNLNYFTLSETLIYFFEKNALIYLSNNKKSFEKEPSEIFKKCREFLNNPDNSGSNYGKIINITILFCLGFIKAYCYTFIKLHDQTGFKQKDIIENFINGDEDMKIVKMIKLYIYKIIYNFNNKQIDVFLKKGKSDDKYKLKKYSDKFLKFKGEKELKFEIETLDDDNNKYNNLYNNLVKLKEKDNFNNQIKKEDLNEDDDDDNNKIKFDNFYVAAYNLILSKLNKHNSEIKEIHNNFYKNVCEPLFKKEDEEDENNKLLTLIQYIFDPDIYMKIKEKFDINTKNIEVLLYGYRYCLNEIAEEHPRGEFIFASLYNKNKIDYLETKFYPGSDPRDENYYELYNKIEEHFIQKPNEGCYVCLCEKGYYHSIPSGFPGISEKNLKCYYCNREIGSKEVYLDKKVENNDKDNKKDKLIKTLEPINRNNYYRIFNDEDDIDELNKNSDTRNMLNKINHMTKKDFKEKYIINLYNKEKGLNEIDANKFKKDNKIIRNLSQISYRLLNYILYCHLFFAGLYTNLDEKFDIYLPKGMNWFNTIYECYILLKKELEKKGIKRIDIFMNIIFKELFNKLHDQECINKYTKLIEFEKELESLIQEKVNIAKGIIEKFNEIEKESFKDKTSAIALLKEIYNKDDYNKNEFPYYEHFYYTDYPDENYILDLLEHEDKDKYPLLIKYLEYKKDHKKDKDNYSTDNFIIFNKVLNLFNERYSNQITRKTAEKQTIKDCDIYQESTENSKLIDKFVEIYNNFNLKHELKVSKNCIGDLVLDDNNKYGKTYIALYKKFAELQNDKLKDLINKKCVLGVFKSDCINKINIQQIKEDEIFTFNIPKKFNFINVVFNSSYRRVIDTGKYENYNDINLNLESIEKEMTELLLKNKKLLNCDLILFKYNDEVFSNEINNLITNFESKYNTSGIDINDKLIFYEYAIKTYEGNKDRYERVLNGFITMINYLYRIKIDDNNKSNINEDTKISEIVKNVNGINKEFIELFNDKNEIIVKKISNCFDYYLKLIFKYIIEDIKEYQEIKTENDKSKSKIIKEAKEYKESKKTEEKKDKDEFKTKYRKEEEKKNPINNLDDKTIKKLDDLFKKEDNIITKESLRIAIRLFISIILYREKDKVNKIKLNKNNIIGYLKEKDLWKNINIRDKQFNEELENIKLLNIKISKILWLYYYLSDNKVEEFDKDAEEEYVKRKNKTKKPKNDSDNDESEEESEGKSENESNSEIKDILGNRKESGDSKNSDNSDESKSDKSSRKNSDDSGSESDGEDKKDARDRGD